MSDVIDPKLLNETGLKQKNTANFVASKKNNLQPSNQQGQPATNQPPTRQQKTATNINSGIQTMKKTAYVQTMNKVAAAEQFDREQAFEIGFAKAAHDVGLSKEQFQQMYSLGIQKLSSAK